MDMLKVLEYEYKDIILKELDTEARVVFGEGNPSAKIVLIGEAPGKKEEETGKAFVGSAGKNLDEFLKILELNREDIYITNVVKIRTYKVNNDTQKTINRTPNKREIDISIKTLIAQLEIIKPNIVVTLGNIPLKAVLGDDNAKIGDYHGLKIKLEKFDLFPLYHPASIIYNKSLYQTYIEDVVRLKEYI
jgi:uracil-DNA glycosylase